MTESYWVTATPKSQDKTDFPINVPRGQEKMSTLFNNKSHQNIKLFGKVACRTEVKI